MPDYAMQRSAPFVTPMKTRTACVALALTSGVASAAGSQSASDSPECGVMFVAHRGGQVAGYPENTLAAFSRAVEHGADAVLERRGGRA